MVVAAFHLHLFLFFIITGFVKSSLLCTCVKDNVHIYSKEDQNMTAIIDTLSSGNCVIHIDNNSAWVKVLTSKKQVGYIRAADVTIKECKHVQQTGHRMNRFLDSPNTNCLSEHCLKCFCEHGTTEHGCGDCHGHHSCPETNGYCSEWNSRVDGQWSNWQPWQPCTVTCGGGTHTRVRYCDNPPKKTIFGADCSGQSSETEACNTKHCPVDGGWSEWTDNTLCSVTCGGGKKTRLRKCSQPQPEYGGQDCQGNELQIVQCNTDHCKVNGGWTAWSTYTACSVSCGGSGTMVRQRTCDNPTPQYGGADCVGIPIESAPCKTQPCSVNGGWTAWSTYSTCSVSCGSGIMVRKRTCSNPTPQNGGADCVGFASESLPCTGVQQCQVNGNWNNWSSWQQCSATCGTGSRFRYRVCDNPKPANGGLDCFGDKLQEQQCATNHCPINGGWSAWGQYTDCSAGCGSVVPGFIRRDRTCDNPLPQYNGSKCPGDSTELQICQPVCSSTTAIPTNAIQLTTTKVAASQPVNQPSTTLHTCDKLGIVHALGSNLKVTHSLAKSCPDGSLTSPETVAMEFCGIQRSSTWRKGISVLDACNQHILTTQYVPVASYQGLFMNQYSGVFVGCEPGGFEIAMQLCGHPVTIHHITDTTTGSPFNPNNYYIVS